MGLVAGYFPVVVIPSPAGRCISPSEESLATISQAMRPGVEVRSVRAVRHREVTYIAGTTVDDQAVSWQQVELLGGVIQGTGSLAAMIAPPLGAASSTGGDDLGRTEALRKAEACSKAAASTGDRAPLLLVLPPQVDSLLGTLQISGSARFDLSDLTAACIADTSAVVQTGAGGVSLIVSAPQVLLTVGPPGSAPSSYRGTTGAIVNRILIVDGTLQTPGVGGSISEVRVTARVPCAS